MENPFDEAYYQRGEERGTQYRNYAEEAKKNRTYFDFAEAIVQCFEPSKTLEIGCATGATVDHLNTFGVDAHGLDISEWAVENRLHPNVILGSADNLPYEDKSFDVVFSCHALEHLPTAIKDKAISEMGRVCRGFQFHMLPILESGPYVGDRFGHLLNLRTDKTHNLLFDRTWWLDQLSNTGWTDTGFKIAILHDNDHFELSDCQFTVSTAPPSLDLLRRVAARNFSVARQLSLTIYGKPAPGFDILIEKLRNQ